MKNKTFKYLISFLIIFNAFIASTSGQEKPFFSFGLMTDVQYADRDNSGTRYYRNSLGKLKEAVQIFNKEKVAFVLHLGDLINDNLKSFDTILAVTQKLEMPLYLVPGNHEFGVDPGEKGKVLPRMGLPAHPYRAFVRDGWRFILVDGSETGVIRYEKESREYQKNRVMMDKMQSRGATNVFEWNGGISRKQSRWIGMNLKEATRKGEKVVLCCHYPLTPEKAPENLLDAPVVKALIEKYPLVFGWLNGHVHVSQFVRENGVNYVSFRGMVEKNENAFCIVSVYNDRLDIKGYGTEISRRLFDKP
jgi:manganese-dependent ADP-ribose/CDP-alcohol diphosphatase